MRICMEPIKAKKENFCCYIWTKNYGNICLTFSTFYREAKTNTQIFKNIILNISTDDYFSLFQLISGADFKEKFL